MAYTQNQANKKPGLQRIRDKKKPMTRPKPGPGVGPKPKPVKKRGR